VRFFVLTFDRAERRLLEVQTYRKPHMAETYARNAQHLAEPDVEVHNVAGDDLAAVIASHPELFDSPDRALYGGDR
jgi:hypothetical protein